MVSKDMSDLVSNAVRQGIYTHTIGRRILYYPELTSTMNQVAELAAGGADEGVVVIAERQTAGRGRQGRSWVSQPGNLLLSVLLRPQISQLPFISIIGGLATVIAIQKVTGLEPRIKWPNDVTLLGRKVAGILAESAVEGQSVCYAVLGIGLNVASDHADNPDIASIAISLETAASKPVPRPALLRQMLMELDGLYRLLPADDSDASYSPIPQWSGLLETTGQRVVASFRDERMVGEATGVDETGNLILRLDTGKLITLTAGDVTLGTSAAQPQ